jgi:hypothetical protein
MNESASLSRRHIAIESLRRLLEIAYPLSRVRTPLLDHADASLRPAVPYRSSGSLRFLMLARLAGREFTR